jgi:hypothetical protein
VVVDWTLIDNAEASRAFTNQIVNSPRSFAERTSISAAIDFSAAQFDASIGGLEEYYRREVTGGSNAFAVIVNDFAAFSEALARKLATEIAEGAGRRVRVSANLIDWAPPPTSMEKE